MTDVSVIVTITREELASFATDAIVENIKDILLWNAIDRLASAEKRLEMLPWLTDELKCRLL